MSNSRPTEKNQECDEDAQDRKASNKNTLNHVPVGKHLSSIRRDRQMVLLNVLATSAWIA